MRRGQADRQAFMPASNAMPCQITPEEEKGNLENVARKLEEELRRVNERIERLNSAD